MESNRGAIYHNPVTQERAVLLVGSADSGGELTRAELWVPPGARVVAPHLHPRQSERFQALEGRLGVRYGADTDVLGSGSAVEVPPGTVHDWWTHGEEPARVLVEVRPALRFEEAIVTLWGLAAAGRTDPRGLPGPLQATLLSHEWADTIRFVSPPWPVQRLLYRVLGPLARRRGLRGGYPEFESRILLGRLGEVLTLTGSEPAGT